MGYCRANQYGQRLQDYFREANDASMVCVQIEEIAAIDALDEILSVAGVDVAMIGPYDLSSSMGITGEFEHPAMVEALAKFLEACKRHGVIAGTHVIRPDPELVRASLDEGYRFIAYCVDVGFVWEHSIAALKALGKGRAS